MKELYKVSPSTGKMLVWWCEAVGSSVTSFSCEAGGKVQEYSYEASAKNEGRSNATTAEEQALVEVEALYEKQQKNKHYRPTMEEALELFNNNKIPRKLHNYKDHAHKLPMTCLSMVKYNGLRACVLDGKLKTKAGLEETIKIPALAEAVEKMKEHGYGNFDAEIYAHGLSLQRIKAAFTKPFKTDKEILAIAKKRTGEKIDSVNQAVSELGYNPNEDAAKLKFVVFDIPVLGKDLWQRLELRSRFFSKVEELGLTQFFSEAKDKWTHSPCHREELRDKVVSKGLEGLVHYCPTDTYIFDTRTYTAQKDKPRYSAEAKVVNCTEDKSRQGVLELEYFNGETTVTFKGKMKGSASERAYEVQKQLVGQWVEFEYEELSDSGVPTKPVILHVRECDDEGIPVKY